LVIVGVFYLMIVYWMKNPRFASTWLSTALSAGEVGSVSRGGVLGWEPV
jgi:hypothetical protein